MSGRTGTAPYAFVFPGQGAQALGMAVDLCEARPEARAVFERGREVLGWDVLSVCRDGPQEELNSTRVSQPAIFLHSMAALEVLRRQLGDEAEGIDPSSGLDGAATAGLSLGEYSALVFAGALSFEDALRVVGKRGEYMQAACDDKPGTMASVLGLEAERIEEIAAELQAQGREVWVANYNSPGQTVISGEKEAVAECCERLKGAGARRAIVLRVAGAYHSKLMSSATEKMRPLLEELAVSAPRLPFFQNYAGGLVDDPERIREGLLLQVESPVRWEQCVRGIAASGVSRALEVGPGRTLKGLVQATAPDVEVESVGTLEALGAFAPVDA